MITGGYPEADEQHVQHQPTGSAISVDERVDLLENGSRVAHCDIGTAARSGTLGREATPPIG